MSAKYSVQVRIIVKGSKHAVTGNSSYSSGSYDKKFKNAVQNAIYIDASNRGKKLKYDTKYNYKLISSSIGYVGKPKKHAKRGVNRRLHNEIILENTQRVERAKQEKKQQKQQDKPISKKKADEQMYGKQPRGKTMEKKIVKQKQTIVKQKSVNAKLLERLDRLERENRELKQQLANKKK